jgi:hypothetical protein
MQPEEMEIENPADRFLRVKKEQEFIEKEIEENTVSTKSYKKAETKPDDSTETDDPEKISKIVHWPEEDKKPNIHILSDTIDTENVEKFYNNIKEEGEEVLKTFKVWLIGGKASPHMEPSFYVKDLMHKDTSIKSIKEGFYAVHDYTSDRTDMIVTCKELILERCKIDENFKKSIIDIPLDTDVIFNTTTIDSKDLLVDNEEATDNPYDDEKIFIDLVLGLLLERLIGENIYGKCIQEVRDELNQLPELTDLTNLDE